MKKLFAILFLFLFLFGCKSPEPTITNQTEIQEEPVETSEQTIEEVDEEPGVAVVPSEPSTTITVGGSGEALSQVRCAGDKIEGIVTNIADRQVDILKEASAVFRGVLIVNPSLMECEKTTLNPGDCGSLVGKYPVGEKNRFIFRIAGLEKGVVKVINCSQ
jgi:hypothetical protein